MRVVALISGGKDSCFNMMQCVAAGHEIVALANLQPQEKDELDSYMYQTVGHDGIGLYSDALELPLYRGVIKGNTVASGLDYLPTEGDEVEDLFTLLSEIKEKVDFDAVAVGAILSDYQRTRVENVCVRLGCVCLAYLWRRSQTELLQEMIDCGITAIIIKTACLGLDPAVHLGQTIAELQPHLLHCKEKYGINVCGEGGEYETFTLDCPLFKKAIVLDEFENVVHSNDAFAPVGYMRLREMHLITKPAKHDTVDALESSDSSQKVLLTGLPVKAPLDYLEDLAECTVPECCDGREEICNKHLTGDSGDSNAFSSNSSNCSGGDLEKDLATQSLQSSSADDLRSSQTSTSTLIPVNGNNNEEAVATAPDTCCQFKDLKETQQFIVQTRAVKNESGWCWIMGVCATDNVAAPNDPMTSALLCLQAKLEDQDMDLKDLVSVVIYLSDMNDYAKYNQEYIKFFAHKPPVRVCVATPLPQSITILLEGLAFRSTSVDPDPEHTFSRKYMHVQGISHWAPANIGPYSQANWVGDVLYVAGQIGLVPGIMKMVEGGCRMECKLALRHVNRVLKATDLKVELRDVVQSICYVTDASYIVECREEWEKRTNNAIVEYVVVSQLPRDALVEWQVWAHKHNAAFEYEETGCYIGSGIRVRLTRRSSYESRVAAIVCRACKRDKTGRFDADEIGQITDYALNKLVQDANAEAEKSIVCSFRVFYRIGAINPVDIYTVLESKLSPNSVTYSILPVCSLMQDNTVLSLCGVRHL